MGKRLSCVTVSGCRLETNLPPLPPGFKLDNQPTPPLPTGFKLDSPSTTQPTQKKSLWAQARELDKQIQKYDIFSRGVNAIGEPLMSLASSAVAAPVAGLAGIATGGDEDVVRKIQGAMTYEPRTPEGRAVSGAISYPFEKLAQGADKAGGWVSETTGSPALGATVNTAIQALPGLLGARGTVKNVGRASNLDRPPVPGKVEAPPNPAPEGNAGLAKVPPEPVPTKAQLAEAADAAYKRADEAGVVVKADRINALKQSISRMAKKEGINPTLHPDTTAALKQIVGSKGDLTLTEVETLRKVAKDAEGSLKPADKRLAGKVVDEIDDLIDNLGEADVVAGDATKAAALKEARNLYSRKKKADVIEGLQERAKLSAANFSASGAENALRTEFRNLAKNERKMRLFTAEEQAAIRKVATGGPMENAFRFIGKFAPTGIVSATLSGGLGGVLLGPAGVGIPLAGLGGRAIATRMTKGNVRAVDELVRRGPQSEAAVRAKSLEEAANPPVKQASESQKVIAEELLRQRKKGK